jgi:O-antigen biosynthesis protein
MTYSPEQLQKEIESRRLKVAELQTRVACAERALWGQKARRADLTARLGERDEWIDQVRKSRAWRLIKPVWKFERYLRKHRSSSASLIKLGELVFGVDPVPTSTTSSRQLTITGWCFSDGGPEVVGIRARLDRKSYFACYPLTRNNITSEILDHPAALQNGFSVTVPDANVNSPFSLEAIAQGGRWQRFFSSNPNGSVGGSQEGERVDPLPAAIRADLCSVSHESFASMLRFLRAQAGAKVTSSTPTVSVVTPYYEVAPLRLMESGANILRQSFPDWEWCIVASASTNAGSADLLPQIESIDSRFRLLRSDSQSISDELNKALELVAGEAVLFLKTGDLLHPEALRAMVGELRQGYDIVYGDEDKFDEITGERREPFHKPDWSPEYLRGTMYVTQGLLVHRELARRVWFNPDYDGIEQFEFLLRATETGARVGHVAAILYDSRKAANAPGAVSDDKLALLNLQERAVNEHLRRTSLSARVERASTPGRLKMMPLARRTCPKISIIIPTKDAPELLSRCLESLYHRTTYAEFETILIDNQTTNKRALELMRDYPITRVDFLERFNFCRANNLGAMHASGEYLVFLNNDTEIIACQWLDHLLYYVEQSDVGAAGGLLLHDDGTIQHAGVILGMRGTGDHAVRGFSARSDGYRGNLSCAREVSAVTAACMMMSSSLFRELGGFDERFSTMYQDLDLCLRVRERGLRIIWTPRALLLHHESVSRSKYYDESDRTLLLERWKQTIERGDPYYNRNLSLDRGDFGRR